MHIEPQLTDKQQKAFRLAQSILCTHFGNHVVIADYMRIDGSCSTAWGYAGNLNAVLGMMERYKNAIHNQYNAEGVETDEV